MTMTKSAPAFGPGLNGLDLTPHQQLAVFARILYRAGYDDGLAGHITWRQPDGTLLVNPFAIPWDEIRASDVARTDIDGNHLEGPYAINPATNLHFVLHKMRHVDVAVHNHPRYATLWADHHRIPPAYDQSSALFSGKIGLVKEYDGTVLYEDIARGVVEAMGDADMALLANHGVLVLGDHIPQAVTRAIALEVRCRNAWMVEAMGDGAVQLPAAIQEGLAGEIEKRDGTFPNLFEACARREVRQDPTVLD
jgi:ribulose-5-phosphate 4-epimerase/fuculose-1-phosphate aldolase